MTSKNDEPAADEQRMDQSIDKLIDVEGHTAGDDEEDANGFVVTIFPLCG